MNTTQKTHRCKVCKSYKDRTVENFARANMTKDGLSNTCLLCETEHRKAKAVEYKAKAIERAKAKQANKAPSVVKEVRQPIKLKPQSELDKLFSLIIRTAHEKFCHACGQYGEIGDLQVGHIVNRTKFAVRYHLFNALPVCTICNYFVEKHTEPLIKRVVELYGENAYDEVNIKRYDEFKATTEQRNWLEAMFKTLLKSLTEDTERNVSKLIETQKMIDLIFCEVV